MSTADDGAAVRALYQESMDGWNKGSGESFAAPFAGPWPVTLPGL